MVSHNGLDLPSKETEGKLLLLALWFNSFHY